MANAGELKSINDAMETDLKVKKFNSPQVISNLKKAKVTPHHIQIAIYSQPDLEHQSEDYLREAGNSVIIQSAFRNSIYCTL